MSDMNPPSPFPNLTFQVCGAEFKNGQSLEEHNKAPCYKPQEDDDDPIRSSASASDSSASPAAASAATAFAASPASASDSTSPAAASASSCFPTQTKEGALSSSDQVLKRKLNFEDCLGGNQMGKLEKKACNVSVLINFKEDDHKPQEYHNDDEKQSQVGGQDSNSVLSITEQEASRNDQDSASSSANSNAPPPPEP